MKTYNATVGVYVRTYGQFEFTAESDEVAAAAAIAAFKSADVTYEDHDWDNLAMPSIVTISQEDGPDIFWEESHDFALTADDRRDMIAGDMLEFIQQVVAGNTEIADLETAAKALLAKALEPVT